MPVLPLSLTKLFLAASWWDRALPDRSFDCNRSAKPDKIEPMTIPDMIVIGRDLPAKQMAVVLRKEVGTEGVLVDLERFGFGARSKSARDDSFCAEFSPEWRETRNSDRHADGYAKRHSDRNCHADSDTGRHSYAYADTYSHTGRDSSPGVEHLDPAAGRYRGRGHDRWLHHHGQRFQAGGAAWARAFPRKFRGTGGHGLERSCAGATQSQWLVDHEERQLEG
jgi:hypothetical protein